MTKHRPKNQGLMFRIYRNRKRSWALLWVEGCFFPPLNWGAICARIKIGVPMQEYINFTRWYLRLHELVLRGVYSEIHKPQHTLGEVIIRICIGIGAIVK